MIFHNNTAPYLWVLQSDTAPGCANGGADERTEGPSKYSKDEFLWKASNGRYDWLGTRAHREINCGYRVWSTIAVDGRRGRKAQPISDFRERSPRVDVKVCLDMEARTEFSPQFVQRSSSQF